MDKLYIGRVKMITYEELLSELLSLSEENFAAFQKRIIKDDKLIIMGVRTPILRKLAKKYKGKYEELCAFPNEYYEVVFLKLAIAAQLPFDRFIEVCDECVDAISDWALCDTFTPPCIAEHREDFIPFIKKYLDAGEGFYNGGEFVRRFALTTLLSFYVEEEYLPLIFDCITACNPKDYYVMMGAAWLLAEVIIKHYKQGLTYLHSTMCDINIKNKAISKLCDSFRVREERKNEFKAMRVKKHT